MKQRTLVSRQPSLSALCALVIAGAASLHAQSSSAVVVPKYAAFVDGNRGILSIFQERVGRRVQVVIGEKHLASLAGKRIYEIAFRKDVGEPILYDYLRDNVTTHMRVLASFSAADPRAPSITFSQNHGANPVEVYRGPVSAPRVQTKDSRALATFSATEAPTIRFSKPISHVPGMSLVLSFITDGGQMGYQWLWPVDAEHAHMPGETSVLGTSCWPAKKTSMIIKGSLRPGMHIKTESSTPPVPIAAFILIGASDKFAFGSLPLPLRLAEPGCDLFVSPDFFLPAVFHRGTSNRSDGESGAILATPYQTSLYGSTFYLQHLFLQQGPYSLNIKTSNGVRATFTKVPPVLGASMVASIDKDALHGRVFLDFTPVMRILAK